MKQAFEGGGGTPLQENSKKERESTRESLYEKIDKKIAIVVDVMDFAETGASLSGKELGEAYNKKLKEIMDNFGNGVHAGFEEIIRLKNEGDQEALMLFRKNNEDAALFFDLANFITNAHSKRSEVVLQKELFEADPADFFSKIKKELPEEFKDIEDKNPEIRFSGYSTNFILDQECFNELFNEEIQGMHLSPSVYNFIRKKEDYEKEIRHEENHSLSDCFVDIRVYHDQLESFFETATRDQIAIFNKKEELSEDDSIENVIKDFEKNVSNLKYYVYENFSEVVADFDGIEDREIETYANNFLAFMDEMEQFMHKIENPEARLILERGLGEIGTMFAEYIEKLSNIFFISKQNEILKETKGALILFRSEKINSVEKFIRHKIGNEKYDAYKLLQPLICGGCYFRNLEQAHDSIFTRENMNFFIEGKIEFGIAEMLIRKYVDLAGTGSFFNPQNIEKLIGVLENSDFKLDESEKTAVAKSLDKGIRGSRLGMDNADKFMDYAHKISKIGEMLDIDGFEGVIEDLAGNFILENFNDSVKKDNYDDMEKIHKKFPNVDSFILLAGSKRIFDLYSRFHQKQYSIETLKDSNFGKFIEKVGLAEEFERFFKERQVKDR